MAELATEGASPPPSFSRIEFAKDFRASQVDEALAHIADACTRDVHFIEDFVPEHDRTFAIVGAGPSLEQNIGVIKDAPKDWFVCAINEAHDYLIDSGIQPNGFAYTEVSPWPAELIRREAPNCIYFIASQCHPENFDRLERRHIAVWHLWQDIGEDKPIIVAGRKPFLIGGGASPTLRAINLGLVLGYRRFVMLGVDGSYSDKSHAGTDGEVAAWNDTQTLEVWCAGRQFKTKPYLARQASDFDAFLRAQGHLFTLRMYGDGLMQHIHRTLYPHIYQ